MKRRGRALSKRYGRAYKGYLAKPLAFPEIRSFHELFEAAEPWDKNSEKRMGLIPASSSSHGRRRETLYIGPYLTLGGGRSMAVRPTQMVIDWIKNNMLTMDDRLFFEIVDRGEGDALVIVSHNKIIGSRWLAMIDASTIPEIAD